MAKSSKCVMACFGMFLMTAAAQAETCTASIRDGRGIVEDVNQLFDRSISVAEKQRILDGMPMDITPQTARCIMAAIEAGNALPRSSMQDALMKIISAH